ncbi:MAG: carboxylesterase/lipase family protein [Acidimicrobiales bacterium]
MTFTAETATGTYVGTAATNGCRNWRGIRYATAERFRAPRVETVHAGTLGATSWGAIAHQTPGFLEASDGFGPDDMSEDCLHLNIWAPADSHSESGLPVLFWVHGGGFLTGSGSASWYDGSNLAARGVVVVTVNYRLGVFGYLGTRNLGLLDQIAALRWTAANIRGFGGDPSKVTVFGESAGGSATVSIMASEQAAGLFHRAWAMSPSIGQFRSRERALELEHAYLDRLGVQTAEDARVLPASRLLEVQQEFIAANAGAPDHFAPTHGGDALPDDILDAAARCHVPLCVGTNRDESRLWSAFDPASAQRTPDEWTRFTEKTFGDNAEVARASYEALRPGCTPGQLMSAVQSDLSFRSHAVRLSDARSLEGTPTWAYWFTWASTAMGGALGSCHALDIPFAFDNIDAPGARGLMGRDADPAGLHTWFADEIVRFAVHGHPVWTQYSHVTRPTMRLDTVREMLHDPEHELVALHVPRPV